MNKLGFQLRLWAGRHLCTTLISTILYQNTERKKMNCWIKYANNTNRTNQCRIYSYLLRAIGHEMFKAITIMASFWLSFKRTLGSYMICKLSAVVASEKMEEISIESLLYLLISHFTIYLVFLKRFLLVPRILLPSKCFLSGPVTAVASTPLSVYFDWKSTTSSSPNDRNPAILKTLLMNEKTRGTIEKKNAKCVYKYSGTVWRQKKMVKYPLVHKNPSAFLFHHWAIV